MTPLWFTCQCLQASPVKIALRVLCVACASLLFGLRPMPQPWVSPEFQLCSSFVFVDQTIRSNSHGQLVRKLFWLAPVLVVIVSSVIAPTRDRPKVCPIQFWRSTRASSHGPTLHLKWSSSLSWLLFVLGPVTCSYGSTATLGLNCCGGVTPAFIRCSTVSARASFTLGANCLSPNILDEPLVQSHMGGLGACSSG